MSLWRYRTAGGTPTDLVSEGFVPAGTQFKVANLNGYGYWYPTLPVVSLPGGLETDYARHLLQWYPPVAVADHVTALRAGGTPVYTTTLVEPMQWVCNPASIAWEAFSGTVYSEICRELLREAWDGVFAFRGSGNPLSAETSEGVTQAEVRLNLFEAVLQRLGVISGDPVYVSNGSYGTRLALDSFMSAGHVAVACGQSYPSQGASGVPGFYRVYARGHRKLAVTCLNLTTLYPINVFATAADGAALNVRVAFNGQFFSPGSQLNSGAASSFTGGAYNFSGVCRQQTIKSTLVRTGEFRFDLAPTNVTFTPSALTVGVGGYTYKEVSGYPQFLKDVLFGGLTMATTDAQRYANFTANTIAARTSGRPLIPWGYVLGLSRAAMAHGFKNVIKVDDRLECDAYASVVHSSTLADAIELAAGKAVVDVPTSVAQLRAQPRVFYGWLSAARERWPLDPLYSLRVWSAAQDASVNLGAEIFVPDDVDTTVSEQKTFLETNAKSNKIRDIGLLGSLVLPGEAERSAVTAHPALFFNDLSEGSGYPAFADEACTIPVPTEDVVVSIASRAVMKYVGAAAAPTGQAGGAYAYWLDVVALHHNGVNYGSAAGSSVIGDTHSDWLFSRCLDDAGFFWGPAALTPEIAMSSAAADSHKATDTFRGLCCAPFSVAAFASAK